MLRFSRWAPAGREQAMVRAPSRINAAIRFIASPKEPESDLITEALGSGVTIGPGSSDSGRGESEEKRRPVGQVAFGADRGAVGQHDVLGGGEAEAGACG